MPRCAAWLTALPDAIDQLEALQRDTITRRDLEALLGLSKRFAVVLMHRLGARRLGNALVLDRHALVRQFTALRDGTAFEQALDRQVRLADTLRQARIHRVRVPVAAATQHIRLASLPAGVSVAPGRIEVTFTGPREAVQQLYALAQALLNDFGAFEKAVEAQTGKQALLP